MNVVLLAVIAGVLALLYALYLIRWILKLPAGEGKMVGVALAIQEGAMAFLNRQYRVIALIGIALTTFQIRSPILCSQQSLGGGHRQR